MANILAWEEEIAAKFWMPVKAQGPATGSPFLGDKTYLM